MANEVKWIKLTTDIFDDEKILMIESMPSADSIIVIWLKLLTFAGKQNNGGVFVMSNRIAYTDEMLACIFRRDIGLIRMALNTFEQFGMIEIIEDVITIPNWEKHQDLAKLEQAREQTRQRVAKHRAKQKLLAECNALCNADVTQTDKDKEEEKELDIDKDKKIDCQQIADLYNSICTSFPSIRTLSDSRRKAIKARLNTYSFEDFKTVFENAEASSFLKGSNDRNWTATFDWLIKDANMAKVLEGNYADKGKPKGRKEKVPGWFGFEMGNAELEAVQQLLAEDEDFTEEAEQLRRELQASFGGNSK